MRERDRERERMRDEESEVESKLERESTLVLTASLPWTHLKGSLVHLCMHHPHTAYVDAVVQGCMCVCSCVHVCVYMCVWLRVVRVLTMCVCGGEASGNERHSCIIYVKCFYYSSV